MAFKSLHNLKLTSNLIRKFGSEAKSIALSVNDETGVATMNLQKPPVNSLNLELLTDICSILTDLEKNKCRGLILTSTTKSVFTAGLDILELYKPDPDRFRKFWSTLQEMWIKLYGCSYPTVAVINGHSPAGGCLLAMSCEYRIMLKNFTIGFNETLLGLVAPPWCISMMKNVIGHRQTELALTAGRLFKTQEALNVGLVDEVVESKEEGLARAEVFFNQFARIPPTARSLTKKSVREETIKNMLEIRENDLNNYLQFIGIPQVQKYLETYLESLKKKSAT